MIVPFANPEGVTVHHNWLLIAVQPALDVTTNGVVPTGDVTDRSDGETDSEGGPFNTGLLAWLKQLVEFVVIWLLMQGDPVNWKTFVG